MFPIKKIAAGFFRLSKKPIHVFTMEDLGTGGAGVVDVFPLFKIAPQVSPGAPRAANSHIFCNFEKCDFIGPGTEINPFVKGTSYLEIR